VGRGGTGGACPARSHGLRRGPVDSIFSPREVSPRNHSLRKEGDGDRPTSLMSDTEEARPLTPDTTPRLPRRTLPTLFSMHRRLWEKVAGRRQRRARPLPPKGLKAPARVARRMPRPGREGPIPAEACQRKGGFKISAPTASSGAGGSEDQCAAAAEDAEYLSTLDSIRGLRWCPCPPATPAAACQASRRTRHTHPSCIPASRDPRSLAHPLLARLRAGFASARA
jgi:hypothetical protein